MITDQASIYRENWKEFCTEHGTWGPNTSRKLDPEEIIFNLYVYSCRLEDQIEDLRKIVLENYDH